MFEQMNLFAQNALGDGSSGASDWRSGLLNLAVFVGAILIPFLLGKWIAKFLKMPNATFGFTTIFFFLIGSLTILLLPKIDESATKLLYGPDIVGGMNLIYEVDRSNEDPLAPRKVVAKDFVVPLINRLNPAGTLEIKIRPNGDDRIEITLPAVDESEVAEIERLITQAGILEFRIVANRSDHKDIIDKAIAQANSDDANVRVRRRVMMTDKATNQEREVGLWRRVGAVNNNGIVEYDGYIFGDVVRNGQTGRIIEPPATQKAGELDAWLKSQKVEVMEILLATERAGRPFRVVNGLHLQRAQKGFGKMGGYEVNFTMTAGGSNEMLALTGANLPTGEFKRRMAILLDEVVLSAPTLNAHISSNGVIQGNFSEREVQRLVDILNGGALPGVLSRQPVARNVVGANMGEQAIAQGFQASAYSLIATIAFMLFYYRFSGLVATLALVFNLVLVIAVMVLIRQPLTLAGVAGLVLSVGMSVDANVLVFERMREEMERKSAPRVAIRNGFDRAWSAIFDSNLTTLISGFILYWVGTEQVKGFAATLVIGIACSMFTAVFFSHKVFDVAEKLRFLSLSMADYVNTTKRSIFGTQDVQFMSYARPMVVASTIACILSLVLAFIRGSELFDIDFNGGTSVVFSLEKGVPSDDVRKIVAGAFDKDDAGLPIQTSLISVKLDEAEKDSVYKLDTSIKKQSDVTDRLLNGFSSDAPTRLVTYDVDVRMTGISAPQSYRPATSNVRLVSFQENGTAQATTEPPVAEISESTPVEPTATPATTTETPTATSETKTTFGLSFKRSLGEGTAKIAAKQLMEELIKAAEASGVALVDAQIELRPVGSGFESWNRESSIGATEWEITVPFDAATTTKIADSLKAQVRARPIWQSISQIEGSVATEMQRRAWAALILSLIAITAYIWFRFQSLSYGIAALVSLIHDVIITLGVLAISHWLFQPLGFLLIEDFKISLTIVAAFLTIIGYSLNDTIVVFDRIREVKGKSPRLTPEMVNASTTQTLSRTLLTSSTTIFALILMYIFGGEGIHAFSFCLLIGIVVGTYSSIFIAAPTLLWFMDREQSKNKRIA
ncbi:MAG: protein translocase subunit SecD [Pirellula sp.]|jgi:SecD/SecF fusion protein